jgi:hypothetical protein
MPDTIERELRAGTERVVSTFTPQSAAELRAQTDRRSRRRRIGTAALSVVVMAAAGMVAFNVDNHSAADHISAAASQTSSPAASAASVPSSAPGSTAPAIPDIAVSLATPPVYSAESSTKVRVILTNPGPTRTVLVVFAVGTSQPIGLWALPCDPGAGACSTLNEYSAGPLKVSGWVTLNVDTPAAQRTVRFNLSLPHGTSSYPVWVALPSGAKNFSVTVYPGTTVLDGLTPLGQAVSAPIVESS